MKDPKGPTKPYRSSEEIAKKHKVPLDKIISQVKIGTKIEGEHTTSKSGAKITALQHVDELPDYYTRLKKAEKKKPMKEEIAQYKKDTKYCLLCKKNETREECSWGPTMWDKYTINKFDISNESKIYEDHKEIASGKKKDEEGYMARVEFDQIERAISILRGKIKKGDQQLPAWVQSKITRAADFIDTAAEYLTSDQKISEGKSFSQFMSEASFEIGSGHKSAQKQAKIRNLADKTTSAGEASAARSKLKGPDWKKPKLNTEGAAWQRKEGKNKEGGLNEKGRKSYEKENPGSDLKPPQPEGGPRKKSFCARMGGMRGPMKDEKGRPTRKALALRKWKC